MMMGLGWKQEKKSFPTPLPVNYCDFHRFTTLGVCVVWRISIFILFSVHTGKSLKSASK